MAAQGSTAKHLSLPEVIKFVMALLVKMAQRKNYGSIEIVVQDGQIVHVHEHVSYRGPLPVEQAAAIAGQTG